MAARQERAARSIVRGDIVLVLFPFSDLSQTKRRPAVVISANLDQTDFTLAFMSSQHVRQSGTGELAILPTHPEFALTGLAVASKIRAAKLVTLSRNLLKRRLGRLGPRLRADLDRVLVSALAISTGLYREEGRRDERERLTAIYKAEGAEALLSDLQLPLPR